jgi:hypothetical protein
MKSYFESSLSRLWEHAKKHDTGTITAFRFARDCGEGKPYSETENISRNRELKSILLTKGFGVTSIKGSYIENYKTKNAKEVKEESLFVVDLNDNKKLKNTLIALGIKYEQDSIIFSEAGGEDYTLISTNKCPNGYPGRGIVGVEEKLGKAIFGKDGEMFSRVNGRPFVFEDINPYVRKLTDYSIPEIRSFKMFAEGK